MLTIIISLIINIFIVYLVYKKITYKIEYPVEKDKSEINSLMIEFNRLTKNNIDLIEEKIDEIKKVIDLADKQLSIYKAGILVDNNPINKKNRAVVDRVENSEIGISDIGNRKKKGDKYKQIKELMKEGKSSDEIAKIMGISVNEVNLYMEMNKITGRKK